MMPNLLYPAKTLAYQSIAAKLLAYPDAGTLLPAYPDTGAGCRPRLCSARQAPSLASAQVVLYADYKHSTDVP